MKAQHKGFSIVEMMVGLTIGMLGMIVIAQVLSIYQDTSRATESGGNSQQNGALSLFSLERDIRQAGYGMNIANMLGCQVLSTDTSTGRTVSFLFAPVVITQGLNTAPDQVHITYSNANMVTTPSVLLQQMVSAESNYIVSNRFGFNVGNLVLLTNGTSSANCDLAQITATPGAPNQSAIVHASTGRYHARQIFNTTAQIYNLGNNPVSNRYSIVDGGLQVFSEITGETSLVADGVVDLQADYGINVDGDVENTVEEYRTSADVDGDGVVTWSDWEKVVAVRIGIVSRSSKKENIDVTTTLPTWAGGTFANVGTKPDWQRYRYQVFETTVLLRNMLWRPQS